MKTQNKEKDVTDTKAQETLDPAGVGELATQVVIISSGNAQSNLETAYLDNKDTVINGHCYEVPLRLRGGGDNDTEMAQAASTSGDMGNASRLKRGPPSPGSPNGQSAKQLRAAAKNPGELDELIGWLEQTVVQEKEKKKLAITVAEKMLSNLSRLRTLTRSITHENSRLAGEIKGKEDAQRESLTVFINKLDAKNAETNSLTAELAALKSARVAPVQEPPRVTYAARTAAVAPPVVTATAAPAATTKSKKAKERSQLEKSRRVKATSRFMVEIPQDMTVESVKAGVWQTVKGKINNPKAKTIVSGKNLIIIPDNSNTLEVMRGLEHAIEIGPRKPRVIIYDVDKGMPKEELIECILTQNTELGLTNEDHSNITPLHKLGPRSSDTVHWVVEVSPSALKKVEDKALYIGMMRCRCKAHS
ncbi:unnamed protein product [Macrosiphum euphorbiae]|uniref:Gag-like protein n=1 Tax=Macrosiphum euphorbiae TaxID=13131 RepID=A0AAV0X039_9HEMI|nr:unnamed protein product [Macrosiphum euphorbiae]